jgi:hypothetical protein
MKKELKANTTAGKTKDWKQLTVRVPPDVHRALRIRAAEEGRSCAIIVEGLVRQYVTGRGTVPCFVDRGDGAICGTCGRPVVPVLLKEYLAEGGKLS